MMNPHLAAFHRRLRGRYARDYADMPMIEWIRQNTTLRGQPFTTEGYAFQDAIASDLHPNLDVIKCSQVGLTEIQVRKALGFLMRTRGTSLIFTLPTETMYERVSKARIQPLVETDRIFNTELDRDATRSKNLMQFGQSFLYVTACTEGDATSIPADAVFNDEVDLSPQKMLALFHSRMQNSRFKINQRFSTPTFPAFGIDLGFQASDQRLYLAKCPACGHWQWPEFTRRFVHLPGLPDDLQDLAEIDASLVEQLDLAAARVVCERCRRPLELGNPALREWVATYPNRRHGRGYWVTPFCTDRLDVGYIVRQLLTYTRLNNLKGWYNTVLGRTYTDGSIRLEVEVIERCFTPHATPPEVGALAPVWFGADVGQTCHVVLGTGTGPEDMHVFRFEAMPYAELVPFVKQVMRTHTLVGGTLDRHPYEPLAAEVRQASEGRILPVEYRGTAPVRLVENEYGVRTHGQVNRTMALDAFAGAVRRQRLRMSGYGLHRHTILEHFRDQFRQELPEQPAQWVKLTGEDHFAHAVTFLLLGPKVRDLVLYEQSKEKPPQTEFGIVVADLSLSPSSIYTTRQKDLVPFSQTLYG